ncbi:MAG TPA: ADOP family duplicated permease [Gemmatimonadaceae bacterium]|nr:ADOP family duplicated permease [Gemmatimonadaceae bacterium]
MSAPRPTGERIASRLYGIARYLVLPEWLDERMGDDLQTTFEERMASTRSMLGWCVELSHEIAGLLRAGLTARFTLDHVSHDVRFALRAMRRHRAVSTLAVLTLAVGVGASTSMYSVIDSVLLEPLPFDHPEQIVMVNPTIVDWRNNPSLSSAWQHGRFSPPEVRAWMAQQHSFQAAGAYFQTSARLLLGTGSESVPIVGVSDGFWTTLRARPAIGRLPSKNEDDSVAVVTHAFWQSHLGGDSAAIGRSLRVDDHALRVIGVLPKDFELIGVGGDLWLPLDLHGPELGNHSLKAIARLRDGETVAHAADEMTRILRGVDAVDAKHPVHTAYIVSPVSEATSAVRGPLWVLMTAAGVLLLAACASVALLLLGSGADRARELAVRQALGANKRRIVGQLLAESITLSAAGAVAGLAVAAASIRVLVATTRAGVPRIQHAAVDLHSFALAALLALATGVLAGCVPAFSLSRVDAGESLRAGATTVRTGRLQRAIVVGELALATVLLVAAGMLTRTMGELQRVNPGFDPSDAFALRLDLPFDRFYRRGVPADSSAALAGAYIGRLTDGLRTIPGVADVATTTIMPFFGGRATNTVEPEGYRPAPGEVVDVARHFVSASYFSILHVRVLQGRLFSPQDERMDAGRVMIVSDAFARHFWPDGRWISRAVGLWGATYRVVGVIGETREQNLRGDDDKFKFYVPARPDGNFPSNFLLRTNASAATLVPILRERLSKLDPDIVIGSAVPLRERMAETLADDRFRMRLMSIFSSVAALFALIGVYGVTSRSVARRRREMGLRAALGAPAGRLTIMVLQEAGAVGAAGALAGVGIAIAGSRALERMIWGVPPIDPITYGVVFGVLVSAALLAALVPARRAAAADVMQALRT